MLRGEERFVIHDLYRKGVSISEIARQTGHDRKTVRSLLHQPVLPVPKPVMPRPRKIDPYIPYLEQRIADGVFNTRKNSVANSRTAGIRAGRRRCGSSSNPTGRHATQQRPSASRPHLANKPRSIGATSASSTTTDAVVPSMPS